VKAPFQLYCIHQGLAALFDRIDDADNPIQLAELVNSIDKLEADKTTRFQELRNAIINEEAKETAIKAEIARLDEMKVSARKTVETLKNAALSLLQLSGDQRIDFPTGGHIRWQNNSQPSVEVSVPLNELPKEWVHTRVETIYSLDREAVFTAKAIGTDVPKEITVSLGQHIRIK
jgi:hypothetical protein